MRGVTLAAKRPICDHWGQVEEVYVTCAASSAYHSPYRATRENPLEQNIIAISTYTHTYTSWMRHNTKASMFN